MQLVSVEVGSVNPVKPCPKPINRVLEYEHHVPVDKKRDDRHIGSPDGLRSTALAGVDAQERHLDLERTRSNAARSLHAIHAARMPHPHQGIQQRVTVMNLMADLGPDEREVTLSRLRVGTHSSQSATSVMKNHDAAAFSQRASLAIAEGFSRLRINQIRKSPLKVAPRTRITRASELLIHLPT
jgi:hypothetical protein